MNQALKIQKEYAINTDTAQGWRLWRALDASHEVEHVMAAKACNEETMRVMADAMTALLKGKSIGVLLGDGEGEGLFAHTVMRRMGEQWPDSRLIARSTGAAFVAITDGTDHAQMIEGLMELARHQEKAAIRLVGYNEDTLHEIRFAGLFHGGADIELNFYCARQPVLRIRTDEKACTDREIWARLQRCWQNATAR